LDGIAFESDRVRSAIIGPNGAEADDSLQPSTGSIPALGESFQGRTSAAKPDAVARLGVARTFQNIEPLRT
jgi:ABC-type branched-subunit amino acid transport system ATPase component